MRVIIAGVYLIKNKINGKVYVGSSVNIHNRWRIHRHDFAKGKNSRYLQRAWDKYGPDAFEWEIVEELAVKHAADLLEFEQVYMEVFESYKPYKGYNIAPKAGNRMGVKATPAQLARMSAATNINKYKRDDLVKITYRGEEGILIDMSRKLHQSPELVKGRINYGWTVEEALETPANEHVQFVTIDGHTKALKRWCKLYGQSPNTIKYRLTKGMGIVEALEMDTDPDLITFDGKTQSWLEWANELGTTPQALRQRRYTLGWSIGDTLMTPLGVEKKGTPPTMLTIDGVTKELKEWAKEYGVQYKTIHARRKMGWTDEESVKTPTGPQHGRKTPS